MPPRISPKHLPQPQSCQCFRTRPAAERRFHASPSHGTRLRRAMWAWLHGPGKVFRDPLKGSTNYLSAYDKQGNLLRANQQKQRPQQKDKELMESEEVAARRDRENPELTEDEREDRAEDRKARRATLDADQEEMEERGGIPKERASDLRPYPLNRDFRSQPVLSEELREQLYQVLVTQGNDLSAVAAAFQVDVRRVAAVVRLKTIEKQWEAEVSH
jgi:transposase